MAMNLADAIPMLKQNSAVNLPADITVGGAAISALGSVTSTSANAIVVGANGATNPVFNVDASASTVGTGFNVAGGASGAGVALTALSSSTNEALTLDAKGSGGVTVNSTATGAVTLGRATTITTGDFTVTNGNIIVTAINKGLSFTGTGTSGGVLTNLYNTTNTTLGGTQKDIKILIGTVPFYFTTYQTKS
jgi:hypothetical protein